MRCWKAHDKFFSVSGNLLPTIFFKGTAPSLSLELSHDKYLPLYLPFLTFLLPQHMYGQYAVLADDAVFLGRVVLLT